MQDNKNYLLELAAQLAKANDYRYYSDALTSYFLDDTGVYTAWLNICMGATYEALNFLDLDPLKLQVEWLAENGITLEPAYDFRTWLLNFRQVERDTLIVSEFDNNTYLLSFKLHKTDLDFAAYTYPTMLKALESKLGFIDHV